ncbi:elastin-like [Trichoplusia ni]|uniref:Elastin-like n=1 Tax=Trichoplusia ni TaxID=7111 RepID=A0A7E5V8J1_TRINI|nr:elastin-like [Trichoplusia ni]
MKVILLAGVFAVVALSVAGAPTYKEEEVPYANQRYLEDYLRQRRTPYGAGYVPPCAAAAASQLQVPVYAAVPQYGVPHYGYSGPHYRSVEHQNDEILGFSDMDVVPEPVQMARYGGYGGAALGGLPAGGSPVGISSYGGHGLSSYSSGPALGVFPNARVSGCNVPLLFSCSPSIVSGHMMESHGLGGLGGLAGAGGASGAPLSALPAGLPGSYRIVDEPVHHEAHVQQEAAEHEHAEHTEAVHEATSATHQ